MATFTNQAQLNYNNSTVNSNIAYGEFIEVLSATKTPVVDTYSGGDTITYIISIVNTGAAAYNGLTVTDTLGSYNATTTTPVYPLSYVDGSVKYYINGVLQTAPSVAQTPPLRLTDLTVPANGNVTIAYKVRVNEYARLDAGAVINNTATITGAAIPTLTADARIQAATAPRLTITKAVSPVPVTENGVLTYTFLIENSGNTAATAADLVNLTDTFDPLLTNLSVTFNGNTWSAPTNYTYDESTGAFATVNGQITVPPATYTQDAATGVVSIIPGASTLVVSGIVTSA